MVPVFWIAHRIVPIDYPKKGENHQQRILYSAIGKTAQFEDKKVHQQNANTFSASGQRGHFSIARP